MISETPAETTYYTVQGIRVDNPTDGLYIVRDTFADGSTQTRKMIYRN
ncbi:MAG: hypothetical protein HDR85_00560 [Bacteroides sp.]|nr:hypothetical protein [Bacteroides sp.]